MLLVDLLPATMPEPQNLDGVRIEQLSKAAPAPETAEWDGKVAKKFEGYVYPT